MIYHDQIIYPTIFIIIILMLQIKQMKLFLGKVKILLRNVSQDVLVDAQRAILIDNQNAYIYRISEALSISGLYSALSREKSSVDPTILQKAETQFPITADMIVIRIKNDDTGLQSYLRELNITSYGKDNCLIMLIKPSQQQMMPLMFDNLEDGMKFCEAFRYHQVQKHLVTCMNKQKHNNRLLDRLCEGVSVGHLVIDPDDFSSVEYQPSQMRLTVEALRQMVKYKRGSYACGCTFAFKLEEDAINYYVKLATEIADHAKLVKLSECRLLDRTLISILNKVMFKSLQQINLSHNSLTDISFRSLISLLNHNPSLYSFDLSHNAYTLTAQPLIIQFLESTNYLLHINLANNRISSAAFILEYILGAENPPIAKLSLPDNLISEADKLAIIRELMESGLNLSLNVGKVLLADKYVHEYLHKHQPDTLLNKTPFTLVLEQVGQQVKLPDPIQEDPQPLPSDQLHKILQQLQMAYQNHEYQSIQIHRKKLQLYEEGIEILNQPIYTQYHEQYLLEKQQLKESIELIDNFQMDEDTINSKLDECVRLVARRGLGGDARDYLLYLKYMRDNFIDKMLTDQFDPEQQLLILSLQHCYRTYINEHNKIDSFIELNFQQLISDSEESVESLLKTTNNHQTKLRCLYLLRKSQHQREQINECLREVKLVSVRYQRMRKQMPLIQHQRNRNQLSLPPTLSVENTIDYLARYHIEKFPFAQHVREKGVISYEGVKHPDGGEELTPFVNVVISFLKFLYHSPHQLLPETIQYLQYIVDEVRNKASPTLYADQFYLQMITFTEELPLGRGILTSIVELTTLHMRHSQLLQPFIISHLLKNDSYPIEQVHLTTCTQPLLPYKLTPECFASAAHHHGMVDIDLWYVEGNRSVEISIHHLCNSRQLCEMVCEKLELQGGYWVYVESEGGLKMMGVLDTVGLMLGSLRKGERVMLKRVVYDGRCWSEWWMKRTFSGEDWLHLYNEVKFNYKYCAHLLPHPVSTLSALLLCEIILSESLYVESVANIYIQHVEEYTTLPLTSDNKLQIIEQLHQLIDKSISQKSSHAEAMLFFIKKCGPYGYCACITSTTLAQMHQPNREQLLIGAHGLLWAGQFVRWEQIYDVAVGLDKIVLRYVKMEGSIIRYENVLRIQNKDDSMFQHLCLCVIDEYMKIRLNSHFQLLYRWNEENGIFDQPLKDCESITSHPCSLFKSIADNSYTNVQEQSEPEPQISWEEKEEERRKKIREKLRESEQKKEIKMSEIVQETNKSNKSNQSNKSGKNSDSEQVITNVRRSGRRELPRRRSSRDR